MIRLKIILRSRFFYISLIMVSIVYTFIVLNFNIYITNYNTTKIEGVITDIKYKDYMNIIRIKTGIYENVLVYDYAKRDLDIGYKIQVEGTLSMPDKNSNFYLFNYNHYLKSLKIHYIMNMKSYKVVNKGNYIYKTKRKIIKRINDINNPYLNMFILGDNSKIDTSVINSYRNNGISHLFAISGMHIGLIVFVLEKILKRFRVKSSIPIIILVFFYLFLTNYSKSVMRSGILFILLSFNNKYKINISTLKIVLIMFFITLLINPYNLYNQSFIFTYIVTVSLIINGRLISKNTSYIAKIFMTSLISFITTIPIMINNYFSINILSILFNVFYVPLVSLIIFPLSIIVFIVPSMNNSFNLFILILEKTSLYLSNVKAFNITLCHINIVGFICYYILIIFVFIMLHKRKYIYLLILIVVIFIHYNYHYFESSFSFTILDVKQGDSLLITYPNTKANILIDTGGNRNNNLTLNVLIPSLKSRGISKLSFLIITHGDYDHMGEAINLVNNFNVEKVIFNCGTYNDLEKELIKVLDKKKIKYYSCIKELNVDDNKLYFLQTKEYDNENDNSNVIYTELADYKFMFMGDAGVEKEKDILEKYNISDMDVLKVGHHGSKTSSSKEFINEVNPKYSIISVGKNNRYGHPNKEVLNNLEDSKIYRTDQDGSIMVKIKNNKLKIETCSP